MTLRAARAKDRMSDEELLREISSDSKLNRARSLFSSWSAEISQAQAQQRTPLSPVDMRKMEFQAVRDILAIYGVTP